MDINQLFIEASRLKLRFDTSNNGKMTVEDLWDLPLQSRTRPSLDSIAIALNESIKTYGEQSFVSKSTVPRAVTVAFEIVKYIIETRQKENADKLTEKANADRIKQLEGILAEKDAEADKVKTKEELLAELAALKGK